MGRRTLTKILFAIIGIAFLLILVRVLEEEDVIKDNIRKDVTEQEMTE
jgi:hypothetical protein